MSEHTPGPWRTEAVKTSIGHAHKIAPINACIYVDHRGTGERDTKTKEAAANARLIAAAPDLLEALEAVAPYYAYGHPHCVQLRAAIAKATNGGWLPPVPPHCLEEERDVSDPRLDVERAELAAAIARAEKAEAALNRYRYAHAFAAAEAWDNGHDMRSRIAWARAWDEGHCLTNDQIAAIGKTYLEQEANAIASGCAMWPPDARR